MAAARTSDCELRRRFGREEEGLEGVEGTMVMRAESRWRGVVVPFNARRKSDGERSCVLGLFKATRPNPGGRRPIAYLAAVWRIPAIQRAVAA